MNKINLKPWLLPFLAIAFILGIIIIAQIHIPEIFAYFVDKETHAAFFILLFTLLPMAAFPIMPFLILLGLKFGVAMGALIFFGGMAVHMTISYLVTHSFLRSYILKFAVRKGVDVPRIPENKMVLYSSIFLAVPGPSYAMKNYLLPLTGIPFRLYFTLNLLIQGSFGIPFIIAGEAVGTRSYFIFFAILMAAAGLYWLLMRIKRKKDRAVNSDE